MTGWGKTRGPKSLQRRFMYNCSEEIRLRFGVSTLQEKKEKKRKKSAPKAPWGGAAGAGRRRRRRRGSAGGAGNNDAVIKTSLWPRVHVFAELGRVRLAHRERARLSSTRPAATRAVPLWAAGSPARAPRAGSVGLGEGDFAEASRSEPTKKRKIFPRHRAPRGPGWACTGTEESPVAAGRRVA